MMKHDTCEKWEAGMLQRFIQEFMGYCRLANLSDRSIQALTARLNELQSFLKARQIGSVKKITYLHLVAFVADFNPPKADKYNRLLRYFSTRANDLWGLRNLIIVMLLGTMGLRTTTLRMIEVTDVDTRSGLLITINRHFC
jgi:integrase/recombinase XerC